MPLATSLAIFQSCNITEVPKSTRMKILLIIFTFCLISDGGDSKEVTGYSGSEVLIKCKYDTEYTQNLKYFCKGSPPGCSDLIKTGDKNMWVNLGRFSLFDDTKSAEFSVMIREITVEDTGTYQCGVDISLVNDIYTTVELKVKEGSSGSREVLLALCDFEEIKDTRQLSASETRFSTIYASLQLLTIPSELSQTVYANTELPASPCDPTVYSTVKFPTNPPDQDFYSTVQLH
ncbi:polymeric immunoglobulin receptor-like isoform X1 [Silurus asotus]|nr:polymeric immunoglobulin receptor-like isoform X1 [Silurus asotus]